MGSPSPSPTSPSVCLPTGSASQDSWLSPCPSTPSGPQPLNRKGTFLHSFADTHIWTKIPTSQTTPPSKHTQLYPRHSQRTNPGHTLMPYRLKVTNIKTQATDTHATGPGMPKLSYEPTRRLANHASARETEPGCPAGGSDGWAVTLEGPEPTDPGLIQPQSLRNIWGELLVPAFPRPCLTAAPNAQHDPASFTL